MYTSEDFKSKKALKAQFKEAVRVIPIREMENGDLGVVVGCNVEFLDLAGEIIFCNVAGWHSLTESRYWPSEYMLLKEKRSAYVPALMVRLLSKGDTLIMSEED
jgi:hypothetical protein